MKRIIRRTVIVLAILAVTSFGLAWVWHEMNVWPQRRALPESASDVHEWFWDDGFLPDYSYYLKARIGPDEFRPYVGKLGLAPYRQPPKYEDGDFRINWRSRGSFHEDWWKPSDSLDNTFVSVDGQYWAYAKYEDGYVYVNCGHGGKTGSLRNK